MSEAREKKPRPSAPGVVAPGELYALDELLARMRWTPSAMRAAKRRGLILIRVGKRDFAMGKDVIAFVESQRFAEN